MNTFYTGTQCHNRIAIDHNNDHNKHITAFDDSVDSQARPT